MMLAADLGASRPVHVITFGAPKPGDQEFVDLALSRSASMRHVRVRGDPIPTLPPCPYSPSDPCSDGRWLYAAIGLWCIVNLLWVGALPRVRVTIVGILITNFILLLGTGMYLKRFHSMSVYKKKINLKD